MLELYESIHKYFVTPSGNANFLGKLIKVAFIIIITKIAVRLLSSFVESSFRIGSKLEIQNEKRAETLMRTGKNIVRALLYFYAILMTLETFNVDTRSILATAGIGGVAIGFGAQSLVRDVLSGFFILQENSFSVGDYIEIKGMGGIVEDMSLRLTKIRDFNGDLYIIPNGEVQVIINRSKGALRAYVLHSIAYEESIDDAIRVLNQVCDNINKEFECSLTREAQIDGVENLGDSGIDIRITAMVQGTYNKWDVERAIRKQGKEALERADIEIPYPRLVTINKEE